VEKVGASRGLSMPQDVPDLLQPSDLDGTAPRYLHRDRTLPKLVLTSNRPGRVGCRDSRHLAGRDQPNLDIIVRGVVDCVPACASGQTRRGCAGNTSGKSFSDDRAERNMAETEGGPADATGPPTGLLLSSL
jgi:hypothetical protein